MSEPQAAWAAAFVAAQAAMPDIPKGKSATIPTKSGGQFSYTYADLPSIIDAVRPVLSECELAVAQSVEVYEGGVAVITRIYHSQGHVEVFGPIVLPHAGDARSAGSAITYARRYALCAALGIAADEDDDAQSAGSGGAGVRSTSRGGSSAKPSGSAATSGSKAPTASGAEAGAQEDLGKSPDASASPDCKHETTKPLRPGWVLCESCRLAFKEGEVP